MIQLVPQQSGSFGIIQPFASHFVIAVFQMLRQFASADSTSFMVLIVASLRLCAFCRFVHSFRISIHIDPESMQQKGRPCGRPN
jgi:hypothetical protein